MYPGQGCLNDRPRLIHSRVYSQISRINQDGIGGGDHWSVRAVAIPVISFFQLRDHFVQSDWIAFGSELIPPPSRALFNCSINPNLHISIRANDRANVAAVEHRAAGPGRKGALQVQERCAYLRDSSNP